MNHNNGLSQWRPDAQVFWAEIAPCDHAVQIYDDDAAFLECLTGFIRSGLDAEQSVIVIATKDHLAAIASGMGGVDLAMAEKGGRYWPVVAQDALDSFMVAGCPDERLFMDLIGGLLRKARGASNRKVRAFGEMVALLWAQGNSEATMHLEQLWNAFCQKTDLCLLCAYPRTGFIDSPHGSVSQICSAHSRVVAA